MHFVLELLIDYLIDIRAIGTAWLFAQSNVDTYTYFKFRADRALTIWADDTDFPEMKWHIFSACMGQDINDPEPSLQLLRWMRQHKLLCLPHQRVGETFLHEAVEWCPTFNFDLTDMLMFIKEEYMNKYDAPWYILGLVNYDNLITRVIEFNELNKESPYPQPPITMSNSNNKYTLKLRPIYAPRDGDGISYIEDKARFMVYAPLTGDFSGVENIALSFSLIHVAENYKDYNDDDDIAVETELNNMRIAMKTGPIDTLVDKSKYINKHSWYATIEDIRKMYLLHVHSRMMPKERIYNNIVNFADLLVDFDGIAVLFVEAARDLPFEQQIRTTLL